MNNNITISKIVAATWKTSLLLHFDEAANATSMTSEEGKVVSAGGTAGAKVSTNAFNDGNSAVIPSGSCIASGAHVDFIMGLEDFTIETWISSAAAPSSGERSVLSLATGAVAGGIVLGFDTGVTKACISEGNGTRILTGNTTFSWSEAHLAYSRKNGVGYLFVNGALHGTITDTRNYQNNVLTIGQVHAGYATRQYSGYIDEVRITKGLGRYTSNFTPATRLSLN